MQDTANMEESYVVFAPLLQLSVTDRIKEDAMNSLLEDGLLFTQMDSELRRTLLDVAKAADCSDDVLLALNESELVFWAQISRPLPSLLQELPLRLVTSLYSVVASVILGRIFNCLMIFQLINPPLSNYCWFHTIGTFGNFDFNNIKIENPKWVNTPMPFNLDWKSPSTHPTEISKGIELLGLMWSRFKPLLILDKIKSVFSSDAKWDGYLNAAEAYAKQRARDLATARSEEIGKPVEIRLKGEFYDDWYMEGWVNAFGREIRKLDFTEQQGSRGRRLICAVQFLSNAHRLPFPHRFIALTTCLEALFSKEPAEVTFQLAARTAWFLEPDDNDKRAKVFSDVISLYKLRSDVVHGRRYSIKNMSDQVVELEILVRMVLMKLLTEEEILNLIFNKDTKAYDKFLAGLSLGQIGTDETVANQ